MDIESIRRLLPFYAANSLDPHERAEVERAVHDSDELRKELEFWRQAKHAIAFQREFEAEAHLSTAQIVDYAAHTVHSADERIHIENHLQSCTSCKKEFDTAQQLQLQNALQARRVHVASLYFRWPQIAFAFAVLVLAIAIYIYRPDKSAPPTITQKHPDSSASAAPTSPTRKIVRLTLAYSTITRNPQAREGRTQIFRLPVDADTIEFVIPVEHSAISVGYEAGLFMSGQRILSDRLGQPFVSQGGIDTLLLKVPRRRVERTGTYAVAVKEILQSNQSALEPERYRYEFTIQK
ncbi:MAG: hypothetical protein HY961_00655 [Ignavibacteriae bacterium]|nr:hypothetical protein [Ignavibacteriota bacterium]